MVNGFLESLLAIPSPFSNGKHGWKQYCLQDMKMKLNCSAELYATAKVDLDAISLKKKSGSFFPFPGFGFFIWVFVCFMFVCLVFFFWICSLCILVASPEMKWYPILYGYSKRNSSASNGSHELIYFHKQKNRLDCWSNNHNCSSPNIVHKKKEIFPSYVFPIGIKGFSIINLM